MSIVYNKYSTTVTNLLGCLNIHQSYQVVTKEKRREVVYFVKNTK
jgi:hypothetical protein